VGSLRDAGRSLGEGLQPAQSCRGRPTPTVCARTVLEFHEGDCHPGDNMFRVIARGELSLSLLQARLIDLGMPIKIVEGT
jgi:hypothetical protein